MPSSTFDEITYTDGYDEIMVHFDSNKRPIRAYVYCDSPLVQFQNTGEHKWKFERNTSNPAFFNLISRDLKGFVRWLKYNEYCAN